MNTTQEKRLYSVKDIMEILQISRLTVYRYIDAGKIHAYKLGSAYRIEKNELERFLVESKKTT